MKLTLNDLEGGIRLTTAVVLDCTIKDSLIVAKVSNFLEEIKKESGDVWDCSLDQTLKLLNSIEPIRLCDINIIDVNSIFLKLHPDEYPVTLDMLNNGLKIDFSNKKYFPREGEYTVGEALEGIRSSWNEVVDARFKLSRGLFGPSYSHDANHLRTMKRLEELDSKQLCQVSWIEGSIQINLKVL